jgi:hypothetical protein
VGRTYPRPDAVRNEYKHGSEGASSRRPIGSMHTHMATENPVACGHLFIAGTT